MEEVGAPGLGQRGESPVFSCQGIADSDWEDCAPYQSAYEAVRGRAEQAVGCCQHCVRVIRGDEESRERWQPFPELGRRVVTCPYPLLPFSNKESHGSKSVLVF